MTRTRIDTGYPTHIFVTCNRFLRPQCWASKPELLSTKLVEVEGSQYFCWLYIYLLVPLESDIFVMFLCLSLNWLVYHCLFLLVLHFFPTCFVCKVYGYGLAWSDQKSNRTTESIVARTQEVVRMRQILPGTWLVGHVTHNVRMFYHVLSLSMVPLWDDDSSWHHRLTIFDL